MKKGQWVYLVIIALSLIALLASIMLFRLSQNDLLASNICTAVDASNPCKTVQESGYSYLFGVHNSVMGIIGFSAMMILAAWQLKKKDKISRNLIILGSFIAGLGAIGFIILQTFVIGAFCVFCMVVDIISIALMGVATHLLLESRKKRK